MTSLTERLKEKLDSYEHECNGKILDRLVECVTTLEEMGTRTQSWHMKHKINAALEALKKELE